MQEEFQLRIRKSVATRPPASPARQPERRVYTPSGLNRDVRTLLERGFPALWVEGELSNLSRPSSGHWYFSLKDESAQVRCAMFRQRNGLVRFAPKDGMHVQARGRISLYEPRGEYQFIVDHLEEAGEGALRRRFEELKARLAAEGLFAAERKRPLPRMPKRIGVITSPTGAAVRDILHILQRRFCSIPVLVYPVPVQGAAAAAQIAAALRLACARAECDVLILARGGGSLEDLWAFNEEVVARAIFESTLPVVSGIGHEIDFTIADFVADMRAPTPSGAAEIVAPDCAEWQRHFGTLGRRLGAALRRHLATRRDRFAWLARRLGQVHPAVALRQRAQRLDELEQRIARALRREVAGRRNRLAWLEHRLGLLHPALALRQRAQHLSGLEQRLARALRHDLAARRARLDRDLARLRYASPAPRVTAASTRLTASRRALGAAMRGRIEHARAHLRLASGKLHTVSPLATLQRGYAIVSDATGAVLSDAAGVRPGDRVQARLARGRLVARVERTLPDDPPGDDAPPGTS